MSVAVLELLVREIALGPLDQAVAPEHGGQKLYQLEATSVPLPTTFFLISYQKPPNACEGVVRERREPPHEDGARWRRYWASPPPPWPTRRVRPGPPAACDQRQATPAPPNPPAARIS